MARLPWIQLGAAFDLAPRLRGLLGVSVLEALGLLAMLDRVAVELVDADGRPCGLFPGDRGHLQLAGAVGWPGDAAGLVQALAEVGKVEVGPDGVRVLGLEWAVKAAIAQEDSARRRAAWKDRQAAERVPNASRTRPERVPNGDEKETQTETHKEKETLGSVHLPPADAAGCGTPFVATAGAEFHDGGIGTAAGELDLGPGATVAAKAVRPRAKKPNASGEPTSGFQALKLAMVEVYEARRRRKYPWHRRDPRGVQECLELDRIHGRRELLRHWIRGLDRAGEKFATGREKVSYIWELPDAWGPIDALLVAEGVPAPAEAVPQEPAWMAGEVGERWRCAVEESGKAHTFGEVAKLLVGAAQDVDVLRLVAADRYGADWIRGNCLEMLQEWLGNVTIEAQPGGET